MCLIEAISATKETVLITPSQLDLGLSLQNPCPFGAQVFAPSGGFGCGKVGYCHFPVTSQCSEHSEHAIHQKPVELPLEGQEASIATFRERMLTKGHSTQCLAGGDGRNRQ